MPAAKIGQQINNVLSVTLEEASLAKRERGVAQTLPKTSFLGLLPRKAEHWRMAINSGQALPKHHHHQHRPRHIARSLNQASASASSSSWSSSFSSAWSGLSSRSFGKVSIILNGHTVQIEWLSDSAKSQGAIEHKCWVLAGVTSYSSIPHMHMNAERQTNNHCKAECCWCYWFVCRCY